MANPTYRIDRDRGTIRYVDASGEGPEVNPEDISNGVLGIENGYLFSHKGGFAPIRIGTNSDSFLIQHNANQIEFINGVATSAINTRISKSTQYGVSGSIKLSLTNGEQRSINIDYASVTPIGRVLIVHTNQQGKLNFNAVEARFANISELMQIYTADVRFATPTEARERAIEGYLLRHYLEDIKDIVDAGGLKGMKTDNTASNVMAFIAQHTDLEYTTQARSIIKLSPPEE